jgi:hypothetical protein
MGLEPRWIIGKNGEEIGEHGIKDRCFLDQTLCQASYKGDGVEQIELGAYLIYLQQVF